MKEPEIGKCTKCGIDGKEVWPEYGTICEGCFDRAAKSKYMIGDVPLVRVVEDLLMERPIVKKIVETAMVDYGTHRILKLENDGFIYMVKEEKPANGGFSKAAAAAIAVNKPQQPDQRLGVHAADPELIPKLNKMIDEHLATCNYCQDIMAENTVL